MPCFYPPMYLLQYTDSVPSVTDQDLLEVYIPLTIQAELAVIPALEGLPIQVFGRKSPEIEKSKRWLAVDVLSMPQRKSRIGSWRGNVLFQVSCFSRDASEMSDGSTDSPRRLASAVGKGLRFRNILIKNYGAANPPGILAPMSTGGPTTQALPPRQGSAVWGASVTFTGTITIDF